MDILEITVSTRHSGLTPARFLADFAVAKSKIAKLLTNRAMTVNGLPAGDRPLCENDVVAIDLAPFEGLDFIPEYGELPVLYEDESVVVFDKPAGIIVHPDDKMGTGTFANLAAGHFVREGLDRKVGYLHRLDRDTTGCLLVAKHFLAHALLASLWDHENVTRGYLALAAGRFREPEGTLDLPLGRDRHVAGRFRVSDHGDRAVTHYEVLKAYEGFALVRLVLETGRTHQIRVHLAHIGHPLLGDALYGGPVGLIARTALHAETIVFPQPLTQATIRVASPLPLDIARLIT